MSTMPVVIAAAAANKAALASSGGSWAPSTEVPWLVVLILVVLAYSIAVLLWMVGREVITGVGRPGWEDWAMAGMLWVVSLLALAAGTLGLLAKGGVL